ncbi:MAG: C1 family peptidase [Aureispira sp.]
MKSLLFTSLCLFFWASTTTQAQPDGFPFGMGIPEAPDRAYEELPIKARLTDGNYRSVDTRASLEKYAPTPKSQGLYGTCTSWAAGYCARTILEAQRYGWNEQTKIDANAFSQGFAYRLSSDKDDCNGAYISECLKKMRDVGIVKQNSYPEDCPQTTINRSLFQEASPYKIKGFATLWNSNIPAKPKQKVQLLKKSVGEGHPVIIAMYIPMSFCYNKGEVWARKSTDVANGNQGHQHNRHAMCLIGYDDEKFGGAFRIQNSWGPNWADKGYIWVKYEDAAEFIYQAVEMFKLPAAHKTQVVELAGSLRLVENGGQPMAATWKGDHYQLNKAYRSGTRFRIYLNNQQAAYVYAIGSDLSNKVYQVFPNAPGVSPVLNYSKNSVPIPSQDQHIRLDGNTGTDFLCVLYSEKPLHIAQIRREIAQQSSRYTFQQKVQRVLGDDLMRQQEMSYDQSGKHMSLSARSDDKPVAALFVHWEHID